MNRQDRDPITALRVVKYMVGGTLLLAGFAILVSIPVALIVGAWVLAGALFTFFGAL